MTIGRNNEAPAAYALTSTIKRLLDHLSEVKIYSGKDLEHITHTIAKLNGVMGNASKSYSPRLITLLANRLTNCQEECARLQKVLEGIDPGLPYEKLISLLRSVSLANTKSKVGDCMLL
jgi:hypothetical protein